jgi:steroid delta-isomerase-like uncharacterized protein
MGNQLQIRKLLSIMAVVMIGVAVLSVRPQQAAAGPNQGGKMSNDANAVALQRFYSECLNQGRFDLVSEFVAADVVNHGAAGEEKGLAAFEQSIRRTRAMFPDPHFTVEDIVSHGDEVAVRWSMVATHTMTVAGVAPTGKQLRQHAIGIYRLEGGKIAEVWLEVDRLGMLQQLGVAIPGLPGPPPVAAR